MKRKSRRAQKGYLNDKQKKMKKKEKYPRYAKKNKYSRDKDKDISWFEIEIFFVFSYICRPRFGF
jgi:hypothetical protein